MKTFLNEFKEFINRGNVMDLAVGVIIGGAFTSIVTALTDHIINPLIAVVAGGGTDNISGLGDTGDRHRLRCVHQRHHQLPDRRVRGVLAGEGHQQGAGCQRQDS